MEPSIVEEYSQCSRVTIVKYNLKLNREIDYFSLKLNRFEKKHLN